MFKYLLEKYPRNEKIYNAMVPRISAEQAIKLYKEGKAIFFFAGSDERSLIPGAIHIDEKSRLLKNPPPKNFLNKYKNKHFVIYCH